MVLWHVEIRNQKYIISHVNKNMHKKAKRDHVFVMSGDVGQFVRPAVLGPPAGLYLVDVPA